MDQRVFKVAALARGYALLARRPEFWTSDVSERLAHGTSDDGPGRLSAFDSIMVAQSGPIDRVCAYAVVVLSRKGGRTTEVLDVLGMLDPDRLVAIYYALPEQRREVVLRDPAWAYHLHQAPRAQIAAALRDLEELDTDPISEVSSVALSTAACGAAVARA
jgi:hypothetical protein